MTSSRKQRLALFREAVLARDRDQIDDHLFRILYGLPADMQIGLVRDMIARFLPVFRIHFPEVTWPDAVLDDLDAYYDEHEEGIPEYAEMLWHADASFDDALCALLRAMRYVRQDKLPRVTPACCTALIWAVGARASNVWQADDPEAVRAWNEGDWEALAGRNQHENVAFQAVMRREYLLIADWLEQRDVGAYPDVEDERETWFEWWRERECSL